MGINDNQTIQIAEKVVRVLQVIRCPVVDVSVEIECQFLIRSLAIRSSCRPVLSAQSDVKLIPRAIAGVVRPKGILRRSWVLETRKTRVRIRDCSAILVNARVRWPSRIQCPANNHGRICTSSGIRSLRGSPDRDIPFPVPGRRQVDLDQAGV